VFGIDAPELLLIIVVAVVVIGPKDLPLALRTAGKWMAKIRQVSGHFRAGLDAMIREAELEEMEKKWREQNEEIMRQYPSGGPAEMQPTGAFPPPAAAEAKAAEIPAAEIKPGEPALEEPAAAPTPPPAP
jgi:sec-independent protein translocase protein TatB